jgi:TonB family protein
LCAACLLRTALSDTTELDEVDDVTGLLPGTTFGPFIVRRSLGRGGMATVYEAVETQLDRAIALKVLPAEFMHDQTFRKRFGTEARLIARLEHPNIVPIYATGIEQGIPWMSMRLLAGSSLSGLLKTRRLEAGEAVRLLRQVASALDYAHAQGVVHRDIKPANILLDRGGTAAVADFGLAQMLMSTERLTQTGIVAGTPHYMAPEQALGKRVDHRCDIYSLGILAYELLTGAPPFGGESPMAILLQHMHQPLPAPPAPASSAAWVDAIRKAVAKDPTDRWESAGAFVDALESSLISVRTPVMSRAGWAALAAAGALALAAIVWPFIQRPHTPSSVSPPASAVAPPQETTAAETKQSPEVSKQNDAADATKTRTAGTTTATRGRKPSPHAGSERSPEPSNQPQGNSGETHSIPSLPGPTQGTVDLERLSKAPTVSPPPVMSDVRTAPEIIWEAKARYPPAAELAEFEGVVELSGTVGVDGIVTDIRVERASKKLFIDAAVAAFKQFRFKPASLNGVPQAERVRKQFEFKLPDKSRKHALEGTTTAELRKIVTS